MDKNKLFVAGIPWSMTNDSLKELFSKYGEITEAVIINDRETGRSKGFGFITFANADDAKKALEMDGTKLEERALVVNIARPRENNGPRRDH